MHLDFTHMGTPHPPISFPHRRSASPKENNKKRPIQTNRQTKKKNKTKKSKTSLILNLSHLSNTSLFVLVAMGATVCHTGDPLVQLVLSANVHCNESLVWFKASGFWYPIITGSSLELLSDTPRLSQVMEILQVSFHWTSLSQAPVGPGWGRS